MFRVPLDISIENGKMTNVVLGLSADLPDSRLAQIARDLSRDLSRAGVSVKPVDGPVAEGERGDASLLGQLALGLVSSGAVTALIQCLKVYLSRERTLTIKLIRPDGSQVEVTSRNVDTAAVHEALRVSTKQE
jgi:hypothetical protein